MKHWSYKDAGVDIDAGNAVVDTVKCQVKKTFTKNVLSPIGGFGALYALKDILQQYKDPVLVQSIDGVGTKVKIAVKCNNFTHLGYDLFSATAGDIVVMGAKPLTFLDYVAHDTIHADHMEAIVSGMVRACTESRVSLVGGETAEMPGVYAKNAIDLVGVVSGVVERDRIITGNNIRKGDAVFGLTSSGLHTNGYSLARKILFEVAGATPTDTYAELNDATLGEALLKPHINYTNIIDGYLQYKLPIKGMAHITGGGMPENIPRILPKGLGVSINKGSWKIPPIFTLIQKLGSVLESEMYRTFNMGIGMVIIGHKNMKSTLKQKAEAYPHIGVTDIGMVTLGSGVQFC